MIAEKPHLKQASCKRIAKAFYGFGDASRSTFGANIQIGKAIHFEYGQWCHEVTEKNS
jgi:hypothetical protein